MRCVNDTLPPRERVRWLLTTMRLSMRSLAGIARTLVAVGSSRLDSMFATVRAAAPLRRWTSISDGVAGRVAAAAGMSRGRGAGVGAEAGAGEGVAGVVGAAGAGAGADVGVGAGAGTVGEAPFCAGTVGAEAEGAGGERRAATRATGGARRLAGACRGTRPRARARDWTASARWGCPRVGSRRRTPTRPGRRSSCRRGTAGAVRRRATRWDRTPRGRGWIAAPRRTPSSSTEDCPETWSGWCNHPNPTASADPGRARRAGRVADAPLGRPSAGWRFALR